MLKIKENVTSKQLEAFGYRFENGRYYKERFEDNGEQEIITINELRQIHYYYSWDEDFLDGDCYFEDCYIHSFDGDNAYCIQDLIAAGYVELCADDK